MSIWNTGFWNNANGQSSNAIWGKITGTLSSQADLQTALNQKLSKLTSATIQTTNFNALIGKQYGVNTNSGVITATLPAFSPSLDGEIIFFYDYQKKTSLNNLIIKNSGGVEIARLSNNGSAVAVIYSETSSGWIKLFEIDNIPLASETQNGLMSFDDFTELLWSTSDNDIHKQDFTLGNCNIPKEITTTTAYITEDSQTITLPDLSTNPNKGSLLYEKDTYSISNHPNSKFAVLIKFARDIIDIDGGIIANSSGVSLPIGTSTIFKWWQTYQVRDANGDLTGTTYNNIFERIS